MIIRAKKRTQVQRDAIAKSRQGTTARALLAAMSSFIDREEVRLARLLEQGMQSTGDVLTYADIRLGLAIGAIDDYYLEYWRDAYSGVVADVLVPAWRLGIITGAEERWQGYDIAWPVDNVFGNRWIQTHGAERITASTEIQRRALSGFVELAHSGRMTVDELARIIRPTIGLTDRQATANINYYNFVKSNLIEQDPHIREEIAQAKAREAANKYASTQHRARAQTIASTELAQSHAQGAWEATEQLRKDGMLEVAMKEWCTAADERTCSQCGSLDGMRVPIDEDFTYMGFPVRPAFIHPRCRCVELYE